MCVCVCACECVCSRTRASLFDKCTCIAMLQRVAVCCSGSRSHKKEGEIRNSFQINTYMNLLQCVVALSVCCFVSQSVAKRKRWWTQVMFCFVTILWKFCVCHDLVPDNNKTSQTNMFWSTIFLMYTIVQTCEPGLHSRNHFFLSFFGIHNHTDL